MPVFQQDSRVCKDKRMFGLFIGEFKKNAM